MNSLGGKDLLSDCLPRSQTHRLKATHHYTACIDQNRTLMNTTKEKLLSTQKRFCIAFGMVGLNCKALFQRQ
jgi:hypothetical protein